jgi:hypothetical protein
MKRFLSCLAACLYVAALPASAQVYRCVDNDSVIISNQPCPEGAEVTAEFTPEPGAAAREAAAKKAADEEIARMKERVTQMERERHEREAALDTTRKDQRISAPEPAPAPRQADEGIVERTVIYPYPGRQGAVPPMYPPRAVPPPTSANRPEKRPGSESSRGAVRPGANPGSNPRPKQQSANFEKEQTSPSPGTGVRATAGSERRKKP